MIPCSPRSLEYGAVFELLTSFITAPHNRFVLPVFELCANEIIWVLFTLLSVVILVRNINLEM